MKYFFNSFQDGDSFLIVLFIFLSNIQETMIKRMRIHPNSVFFSKKWNIFPAEIFESKTFNSSQDAEDLQYRFPSIKYSKIKRIK